MTKRDTVGERRDVVDARLDPFIDGDASVQIHATTCGTSSAYSGHCTLDCECWCHFHPSDRRYRAVGTAR